MMLGKNRAQSTMEYTLFIALFIAALVAMQIYLKRSFQGQLKRSTETISLGEQFSPRFSNYTRVLNSSSTTQETITPTGQGRIEFIEPEITFSEPFKDEFSDKKLTEERLFE